MGMEGPVSVSGTTREDGRGVRCNNPSFGGPGIQMFTASPVEGANIAVIVGPSPASGEPQVMVSLSQGSGATYAQRDFTGPGVTAFDPARGTTFNATLTPSGRQVQPELIGTLTRLTGTIDCSGQTAGTTVASVLCT
jgi:hypothetical protein